MEEEIIVFDDISNLFYFKYLELLSKTDMAWSVVIGGERVVVRLIFCNPNYNSLKATQRESFLRGDLVND